MHALIAIALLLAGCTSQPAPARPAHHAPAKPRAKKVKRGHPRHEHSHGAHPHGDGGHHHHPHPHPHNDGPHGHHHPY